MASATKAAKPGEARASRARAIAPCGAAATDRANHSQNRTEAAIVPVGNPERAPPLVRALRRRQLRRHRHDVHPLRQGQTRRVEAAPRELVPPFRGDGDPDEPAAGRGARGRLAQAPARLRGSPRRGNEAERRARRHGRALDLEDPRDRAGEQGARFFAERSRARRAQRPCGKPEAALARAGRGRKTELRETSGRRRRPRTRRGAPPHRAGGAGREASARPAP